MARLQKSNLGEGRLLSQIPIFHVLLFFLWKRSVFIRVHPRPIKILWLRLCCAVL